MDRIRFTVPFLTALAFAAPSCSRMMPGPTKEVQVAEGGPPVLTTAELAAREKASSQIPGLVSQASFMQPLEALQPLKPFEQWTERDAATDALGRIGAAAVPSLVDALHHPDPAVRLKAVEVLGRMGADAQAAVPELVKLLDDPDLGVRKATARTLGRIGPAAKDAVPALMRTLFQPPQP
ncbi:MAG TPA: HEAT repeat domain-containing protein [Pirellulaceae bacterium]|nr:HEAT repeat domain-containing protein [Pirellulaceae bacterium]